MPSKILLGFRMGSKTTFWDGTDMLSSDVANIREPCAEIDRLPDFVAGSGTTLLRT